MNALTKEHSCTLSGSCSITVDVGGTDTTFTPSVSLTLPANDTNEIEICFLPSATASSGYIASVEHGCNTLGMVDSDFAIANGLEKQASSGSGTASTTSD